MSNELNDKNKTAYLKNLAKTVSALSIKDKTQFLQYLADKIHLQSLSHCYKGKSQQSFKLNEAYTLIQNVIRSFENLGFNIS